MTKNIEESGSISVMKHKGKFLIIFLGYLLVQAFGNGVVNRVDSTLEINLTDYRGIDIAVEPFFSSIVGVTSLLYKAQNNDSLPFSKINIISGYQMKPTKKRYDDDFQNKTSSREKSMKDPIDNVSTLLSTYDDEISNHSKSDSLSEEIAKETSVTSSTKHTLHSSTVKHPKTVKEITSIKNDFFSDVIDTMLDVTTPSQITTANTPTEIEGEIYTEEPAVTKLQTELNTQEIFAVTTPEPTCQELLTETTTFFSRDNATENSTEKFNTTTESEIFYTSTIEYLTTIETTITTKSSTTISTTSTTVTTTAPKKSRISNKKKNVYQWGTRPTCVTTGGKTPNKKCVFPFEFLGRTYYSCTWKLNFLTRNKPWCSTRTDENGKHIAGNWGNCDATLCGNKVPPRECGIPTTKHRRKRVVQKDYLSIEELPWMASLGIYIKDKWHHKCGGSLINEKFILTAAHCLIYQDLTKLRVRLGNADLNNNVWLRTLYNNSSNSAIFEINRAIKSTRIHPRYVEGRSYFDVGLAEVDREIEYTNYVRPICLPFRPSEGDTYVDNLVTLAGWGQNGSYVLTNQLNQARLQVYSRKHCENIFETSNLEYLRFNIFNSQRQLPEGITHDLVCIGSEIQHAGACYGDSGSPSIRKVTDTPTGRSYYEQAFLVVTGVSCKFKATIYSEIGHKENLNWIRKTAGMESLLMVIGGFNPTQPNGLLNDVELLSPLPNSHCPKSVPNLNGIVYNRTTAKYPSGFLDQDAAARGMTGIVAKRALIVCGGTNSDEHLDRCRQYDSFANRWFYTYSMSYPRADASAVLSQDGDFWILGGANGTEASDSTEVLDARLSLWRRAAPLPSELRDSGISYHCSVRLNRTHIILVGGYTPHYIFRPPFRSESFEDYEDEDGYVVLGTSLKAAWMYDGYYWKRLPDMSDVRDRPACSLMDIDGKLLILVAGGCRGWCLHKPAISDSEIYDPEKNTWTPVASLPEPLHSAKMEIFQGYPTIVGGYNGTHQTDRLYRYVQAKDEWELLNIRLRTPRSSHALIQVPYDMFQYC